MSTPDERHGTVFLGWLSGVAGLLMAGLIVYGAFWLCVLVLHGLGIL